VRIPSSIISLVAAGLGFRWLFQTEGPVNALLSSIGIHRFLAGQHYLGSVDFVEHLETAGFNMVVFLAGLQAIPTSRYEAAELDGPMPGSSFGILLYLDYVYPRLCNDDYVAEFRAGLCDYWWWSVEFYQFAGLLSTSRLLLNLISAMQQLQQQCCCWRSRCCWYIFSCELGEES